MKSGAFGKLSCCVAIATAGCASSHPEANALELALSQSNKTLNEYLADSVGCSDVAKELEHIVGVTEGFRAQTIAEVFGKAEAGDKLGQFVMGLHYERGCLVEQSDEVAMEFYQLASRDRLAEVDVYLPPSGASPGHVVQFKSGIAEYGLGAAKVKVANYKARGSFLD